jgi:hypothetical protein
MDRKTKYFAFLFCLTVIALSIFFRQAQSLAEQSASVNPPDVSESRKGKLTGSELYVFHCIRCHAERPPTERSDINWDVISTHMRVRSNLSAKEERKIREYLQASN